MSLKSSIERFSAQGEVEHDPEARKLFLEFRDQLTEGKIRAAEKKDGRWMVNAWVKQGILLGFRLGVLAEMPAGLSFVDKDTFPARRITLADRVRVDLQAAAHRALAEGLGRAQRPAQERPVPVGDVDADLLHQSRRQKSAAETKACSREV